MKSVSLASSSFSHGRYLRLEKRAVHQGSFSTCSSTLGTRFSTISSVPVGGDMPATDTHTPVSAVSPPIHPPPSPLVSVCLTVAVVHVEVDDGDVADALVSVHGSGVGGPHCHVVDEAEAVAAARRVVRHHSARPGVVACQAAR